MKAWLENPKNKLIVMIVCPIIMIAAVILVLINLGVIPFGNSAAPPPPNIAGAPMAPSGPVAPGAPSPGGPGSGPTPPAPSSAKPTAPGSVKKAEKPKPVKVAKKPVKAPVKVAAKPAPKPVPEAKAVSLTVGGNVSGASVASALPSSSWQGIPPPKTIRSDPFKPYKNLALIRMASAPALPQLPQVSIASGLTNAPGGPAGQAPGGPFPPGQQTGPAPTLVAGPPPPIPWKVAGIMMGGAGVKAIVMNGDQSVVVQPGETLPDSTIQVTEITDKGVTVRVNNHDVKLGSSTDNSGNPAAPGQPDAPQPQPQ